MLEFYGAAIALGVAAGAAFTWLWLRLVPHEAHRRFWAQMMALTGELLRVEEARELARLYRRLAALAGRYVARNLGGTLVACLPVLVILVTAAPAVFDGWDARAQRVALVPASAAGKLPSGARPERTAYCSSEGYCALFAALDFNVVKLKHGDIPYAVVRADHGDANPLWPFLSDIEATFFAAFVASTFAGLLWPKRS